MQSAYLHCQDATAKPAFKPCAFTEPAIGVALIQDICGCQSHQPDGVGAPYRERGLTALLDHRQGGNRARLKPEQIEAVQNQLHGYTPAGLLGTRPLRRQRAVLDGS